MLKNSETYKLTEELGRDIVAESRKILADRDINATGKLSKSIKYDMEVDGVSWSMEQYGVWRDAGQLGSKRRILKRWNDSIFIRSKGFTNKRPPIRPIAKWMEVKGVKGSPFAITRKIFMFGIQPGLFFSDAFNKLTPEYFNKMDRAISDDLDKTLDNDSKP